MPGIGSRPRSSATRSGCISAFRLPRAWWELLAARGIIVSHETIPKRGGRRCGAGIVTPRGDYGNSETNPARVSRQCRAPPPGAKAGLTWLEAVAAPVCPVPNTAPPCPSRGSREHPAVSRPNKTDASTPPAAERRPRTDASPEEVAGGAGARCRHLIPVSNQMPVEQQPPLPAHPKAHMAEIRAVSGRKRFGSRNNVISLASQRLREMPGPAPGESGGPAGCGQRELV
jgi:hypothetical protein